MNDIASRIIKEAESEAAALLRENEEALEKMRREAMEGEAKRKESYDEELKNLFHREVQRHRSRENIEGSKRILAVKSGIIEEVLTSLKERFGNDEDLYRDFLMKVMLKGIQTGREEVIVSEDDRGIIDSAFLVGLNRRVKGKLEKEGEVSLSDENRETGGGFFLREGKREFNATIEAAVETVAEKQKLEIIEMLFKGDKFSDETE